MTPYFPFLHLRYWRLFLAPILMMTVLVGCARRTAADPVQLVKATNWHRAFLVIMREEIAQAITVPTERSRFLACTDSADLTPAIGAFALQFEKKLSPADITRAVDFFKGSAGRKLIERDSRILARGGRGKPELIVFTRRELAEIEGFNKSALGNKLRDPGHFSSAPAEKMIDKIIVDCIRTTVTLPPDPAPAAVRD